MGTRTYEEWDHRKSVLHENEDGDVHRNGRKSVLHGDVDSKSQFWNGESETLCHPHHIPQNIETS